MKITIDTKEDSHQDIRKVIAMLNKLVEHSSLDRGHSNMFGDNNSSEESSSISENSSAFTNMFGDSSPSEESSSDSENNGYVNIFGDNSPSKTSDEKIEEKIEEEDSVEILEY